MRSLLTLYTALAFLFTGIGISMVLDGGTPPSFKHSDISTFEAPPVVTGPFRIDPLSLGAMLTE
jgi:hypothetical protein